MAPGRRHPSNQSTRRRNEQQRRQHGRSAEIEWGIPFLIKSGEIEVSRPAAGQSGSNESASTTATDTQTNNPFTNINESIRNTILEQ